MEKKISVIMSVYNDEKYLENAIVSILNQTYQNFEFIICNDCSTDNSEKIIEDFAKKDERIVYLKNEKNLGLAASLTKCLKVATGSYVARMDSDDFSLPERFEKQVNFFEAHPEITVLGGQINHMNGEGTIYKTSSYPLNISREDAVKNVCLAHPTVMMRKEALDDVGGYTVSAFTVRAQDYDLWCKFVEKGYVLHNLEDIVLNYREDKTTIKKRKYIYRIEEAKNKNYWRKRLGYPAWYVIYAIKPFIVGLLPSSVYIKLKNIK